MNPPVMINAMNLILDAVDEPALLAFRDVIDAQLDLRNGDTKTTPKYAVNVGGSFSEC